MPFFDDLEHQVGIDELPRPQRGVLVGKLGLQRHCSGALLNLVVNQLEGAVRELLVIIVIEREDRQRVQRHRLGDAVEVSFGTANVTKIGLT